MEEQNISKNDVQMNSLIEKLIRLDNKETHFQFHDQALKTHFKVHYPHISLPSHSHQNPYFFFWRHVHSHYFKKIEVEELRRLEYACALFQNSNLNQSLSKRFPFIKQQLFWEQFLSVMDPSWLQKLFNRPAISEQDLNWIKSIYIQWKYYNFLLQNKCIPSSVHLKMSQLKQNTSSRLDLSKKALAKFIKEETAILSQLIEYFTNEGQEMTQIDKEIQKLQRKSEEIKREGMHLIQSLSNRVVKQERIGLGQQEMMDQSHQINEAIHNLDCIEFTIKELEEKQLAESLSTIISHQRSFGENRFYVTFQKGLNIGPKLLNQKELVHLNNLRENSLFKFYKTGVKSLYSYVCNNYAGFHQLFNSRNNLIKVKDKDFLLAMKKGQYMSNIYEIQQKLNNFNTCHHCKYLIPQSSLVTCKFASQKLTMPKNLQESQINTSLIGISQGTLQKNRTSHRFILKNKNCLTSYAKINDQYVCGRKYCKACIKDYYSQQSILETGICPFCEGCCTCTRCVRNQKIVKFKSLFINEGGDINKIQDSVLNALENKETQLNCVGKARMKKKFIQKPMNLYSVKEKIVKFKFENIENINKKRCANKLQTLNREKRFLKKKQKKFNKFNESKLKQRYNRFNQNSQTQKGSSISQKQNTNSQKTRRYCSRI